VLPLSVCFLIHPLGECAISGKAPSRLASGGVLGFNCRF
jgi:hypothetical protein